MNASSMPKFATIQASMIMSPLPAAASNQRSSTSRAETTAPRKSLLAVGESQAQAAGVNVLIAYHSVTGNTEKMAQGVLAVKGGQYP